MALLLLDSLPPQISKGAILRFLIEQSGINRVKIGKIELRGRQASIEIPANWLNRLVRAVDGATLNNRHIRAWSEGDDIVSEEQPTESDHFRHLMALMKLEAEAEEKRTLEMRQRLSAADAEQTGNTLTDLIIKDEYGGLGGRVLVSLSKRTQNKSLPWTRLRVGTPILLSEETSRNNIAWRGVVSQQDRYIIQVALGQWPEPESEQATFRLDLSSDEIARKRQEIALARARIAKNDRLAALRRILLQQQSPQFERNIPYKSPNKHLNPSQEAAVQFALSADDLAIIHGPPGTGKTTTVVELIRQAIRAGQTVLACAPSNLAVDNIFERLLAAGEKAVRLGHPARVLPELREHTLDLLAEKHPDVRMARKLIKEAHSLQAKASKYTKAKPEPGAKRAMRQEAKALFDDARRMEAHAVAQILNNAHVLCATTTGLDSEILGQRRFDLCIIDEACQSTEPGAWIPLLYSQRLVLAGDHCQLPPTVISVEAAKQGYNISLMERLMNNTNDDISRLLTVQYRMNQAIMDFSSTEFYQASLQADKSVEEHLLSDLADVAKNELTETPIHFIDTAGASYDESIEPDGESRLNVQEAHLIVRKVEALFEAGLSPDNIGVIAPYAAQTRLLQSLLPDPQVEIGTVDGFQGREKEAILISLVRSNPKGEIGFLADERRMNVALTRARRKLIVVGDSATISTHPFYQRLLDYFEMMGAYHSVWEEV